MTSGSAANAPGVDEDDLVPLSALQHYGHFDKYGCAAAFGPMLSPFCH